MAASSFFARRLFRSGQAVTVSTDDTTAEGRGVLVSVNQSSQKLGDSPHPLGELPRPLVRFYGTFSEELMTVGGTLTAGSDTYHILEEQKVGGLFTRLTLERSEAE